MKPKLFLLVSGVICMVFTLAFMILPSAVTGDWIKNAQNLIGLDFTGQEIDSMIPDLEEYLESYKAMRKSGLDNQVLPAIHFNPMPKNFKLPTNDAKPVFSPLPSDVSAKEDYAYMNLHQLASLIKSKKLSSENLTRYFIQRLKTYDLALKFVINYTEEYAISQARKMDEELRMGKYRGLLHGIPYGAKDLLSKKGYPTTWGSVPFKMQTFDHDADVITKLEEAGAILIAKMSVGELAWGDVWFGGKTRNPWDTTSGSSGSSAGSASAVSAGCLPFAIGTETLGSIVSPSTICGTTGLRPSFGAVPGGGCMILCHSMDKIGPITRTVEDAAIVYNHIKGSFLPADKSQPLTFPFNHNKDITKLRIGYLKNDFEKPYPFHDQDSFSLSVFRQAGIELIPVQLPDAPDLGIILTAEAGASFDELTRSGQDDLMVRQIRNAWPNVFRSSRFIPAVEYLQANRFRTILIEDMDKTLKNIDVYISPSWASRNLTITNYTGHPSVVLPNGFRNGRPTSITFTGKLYREADVLAVAKFYQDRTSWHHQHPILF